MKYAQIVNGTVKNTIVLNDVSLVSLFSQGFDYLIRIDDLDIIPSIGWLYDGVNFSASLYPNDAYGNSVSFSTNGVVDSYTVSGTTVYNFPHGTSLPNVYLSLAIQQNISKAQAAIQAYVNSKYSLDIRFNFNALYLIAQNQGLTNRMTYIRQLFTWAQSIIAYSAVYCAAVNVMVDPAVVAATTPDFSHVAADPLVTPIAAIQINS